MCVLSVNTCTSESGFIPGFCFLNSSKPSFMHAFVKMRCQQLMRHPCGTCTSHKARRVSLTQSGWPPLQPGLHAAGSWVESLWRGVHACARVRACARACVEVEGWAREEGKGRKGSGTLCRTGQWYCPSPFLAKCSGTTSFSVSDSPDTGCRLNCAAADNSALGTVPFHNNVAEIVLQSAGM